MDGRVYTSAHEVFCYRIRDLITLHIVKMMMTT